MGLYYNITYVTMLSIATKSVTEIPLKSLPRILASVKGFDTDYPAEDIDPNFFLDVARDYFDQFLEDKRKVASEENRYRVESRMTALKRSSEIKINKFQQQIKTHIAKRSEEGKEPEERYLRLTQARIEKESVRLDSKIKDLQKHQDLSVDYNLEAVIYLKVHGV
jgi:hypothetical protein